MTIDPSTDDDDHSSSPPMHTLIICCIWLRPYRRLAFNISAVVSERSQQQQLGEAFVACNAVEILKIQQWSTSFGTSMLNDRATMDTISAFRPDAVLFDSMFPPAAYVSHILGVPLIAFSMVSIPPMNEVLFVIEEPAHEVNARSVTCMLKYWTSLLILIYQICCNTRHAAMS